MGAVFRLEWSQTMVDEESWKAISREFLEAVGAELREERRFRSLNQAQVSSISGLNRTTISDVENARNGSHATAYQYACGLGVRWSVIVARAERRMDERRTERGEAKVLEQLHSNDD